MDMTTEQKAEFEDLCNQLSPENLCCDGEASEEYIDQRFSEIQKRWRELEEECGQKVTEDDVWDWMYTRL